MLPSAVREPSAKHDDPVKLCVFPADQARTEKERKENNKTTQAASNGRDRTLMLDYRL